jgi:MFS superfamily sulfate permease-like transporter
VNIGSADPADRTELLVLDARRIDDIDFTGNEALADVAQIAALRCVPFYVVVQQGRAERAFRGRGLPESPAAPRFFDTIPLAVAARPVPSE